MNIEDKALDIILNHTASSEWEDVCELTWNTDEVQELLIKALNQGQTLPIDIVSNQRELLKHYSNFLYENDYLTKDNALIEYELSSL